MTDAELAPDEPAWRIVALALVVLALGAFFAHGVGDQAPQDRTTVVVIVALFVAAIVVPTIAAWAVARGSRLAVADAALSWRPRRLVPAPAPSPVRLDAIEFVQLSSYRYGIGQYHSTGLQLEVVGAHGERLACLRLRHHYRSPRLADWLSGHGLRVQFR